MTLNAAGSLPANVLALFANSAVRALALGGVAALGLAAFRVRTTSVRLLTWTAVLYASLAMPFLEQILPTVSIPLPKFLQYGVEPAVTRLSPPSTPSNLFLALKSATTAVPSGEIPYQAISVSDADGTDTRNVTPVLVTAPTSYHRFLSSIRWTTVAASFYLVVALLLLTRFFVGLAFSRRLSRASLKIEDTRLTFRLRCCARSSKLVSPPYAFESELISVPLTMGVIPPTILLPAEWRSWDDTKLDAVIAHEVSHVARRDALTQRLSLVHRAIFWFSPLAWWLDRHLADLAEQASDEAALRYGADRVDYARTLLGFFESLQAAPGRVWWQGVSMAKVGQAEQRLERILSWKGSVAMSLKRSVAIVVFTVSLPLVYLAASVHADHSHWNLQSVGDAQSPTPPTSAQSPASAPKAQPEVAGEPATAPATDPAPATAEATPRPEPAPAAPSEGPWVAPVAPVAQLAAPSAVPSVALSPQSSHSNSSYGRGYSYAYGYDDEQRFVIVSGKSDSLTMSGTTEDARHVEKLRKQIPGDFIWFQSDEKSYIIRDQATIDRAKKLWAPQEELGKKQEELGKQQEALGKQQEALGKKMEQIHVNVPDMTAELDKLKAELKQLSAGATVEQVGRIQAEIGDLQSKIGDLQSKAGDQQGKLGEEMGVLGEKQGKLGEQQGELGRQQGELAQEASRKMKQLLEEAIAKDIAQLEL